MALNFIFFLICVVSPSLVYSRHLEDTPKTSYLDVAASIQRTNDILSFNPETLLQQERDSPSGVKLYSRHTLEASRFESYKNLLSSILGRDASRVKYISNKLALGRVATSGLSAPLVAGPGEYYARIGFGTPRTDLLTIIDSGSDITWIQCEPCRKCFNQTDPIFDPSTSSTYEPISCSSQLCSEAAQSSCSRNTCTYEVHYGDGSFTTGDFAKETLRLGKSTVENVRIGCGHDNEGLFKVADGLLGLGRSAVALPSQTNASAFSYCMVDMFSTSASTLELGSSTVRSGSAISTPLLGNASSTFYYVGLSEIIVGGESIPVSASDLSTDDGVIVDSGTTVTRFPPDIYNAMRDEFVKGTSDLPSAAASDPFDTCYNLKTLSGVHIPTVAFKFGEGLLTLPAENVLFPVEDGTFCFAFASLQDLGISVSIIGNIQQQGIRVGFDLGNSLVQFSPNQC